MAQRVTDSKLDSASRRLKNSLCQSSGKWLPFSNQERIRQRKERDGLRLSYAVSKTQWASNPNCSYATFIILQDYYTNGTVTDVDGDYYYDEPGWVQVLWDFGESEWYRMGAEGGMIDLKCVCPHCFCTG